MRIRVSDLPPQGRNIEESLAVESLNARMNEATDNDILFLDDPKVVLFLRPRKGGVEVNGSVETQYQQPCSRCMEPVTHVLSEKIDVFFKQVSDDQRESTNQLEDDVGISYFSGEHVELEEFLQEVLILALQPFNSQHSGCEGLAIKNEEKNVATFSDLFKRSGILQ